MFLLWILVLIGIPLVLGLRTRMAALERDVARQQDELQTLSERLRQLKREGVKTPEEPPVVAKPPVVTPPAAAEKPPIVRRRRAAPASAAA